LALSGILVVFWASNQPFKLPVKAQTIAKSGLRYLVRKHVLVSHNPVNYKYLHMWGFCDIRLEVPIPMPRVAVGLKVMRNWVSILDVEVRRSWKLIVSGHDNHRASFFNDSCCRLPLIAAYASHVKTPRMVFGAVSAPASGLEKASHTGSFLEVNHDPSPLAINGSFGLLVDCSYGANCGYDAADSDNSQNDGTSERDSVSCGTWWETDYPYSPVIWIACDCGALIIGGALGGIFLRSGRRGWLGYLFFGLRLSLIGIGAFLVGWGWVWSQYQTDSDRCKGGFHSVVIVPGQRRLRSKAFRNGLGHVECRNLMQRTSN
jgi:hypothetical protein